MVCLRFDIEEHAAVAAAPSDTLAAGKCLAMFAARLRSEAALGDTLAAHIAQALEAAAAAPAKRRGMVLTHALYLTAPRKRAGADWVESSMRVLSLVGKGTSDTAAINAVAEDLDISARTVRRYLKKYQAQVDEDRLNQTAK